MRRESDRQAELEKDRDAEQQCENEKKVAESCQRSDLVAQDWGILRVSPVTFLRSSHINPWHTALLYCSAVSVTHAKKKNQLY